MPVEHDEIVVPVEIEVRDEDGKVLGPGEHGEIYVRGEQVSGEYLGLTSRMTSDGWFV